jgi:hypothetical protein
MIFSTYFLFLKALKQDFFKIILKKVFVGGGEAGARSPLGVVRVVN